MKTKSLLLSLLLVTYLSSCKGQEQRTAEPESDVTTERPEQNTDPRGSWTVNKEYDENGNVVKYDSIYSWSSSDTKMATPQMDSIVKSYQSMMQKHFMQLNNSDFASFFSTDSISNAHVNMFFNDSIISRMMNMDDMRAKMDKMREQMMQHGVPKEQQQ